MLFLISITYVPRGLLIYCRTSKIDHFIDSSESVYKCDYDENNNHSSIFRLLHGDLGLSVNKDIALTGATGFIGTRLIDLLAREGWNVRALYRPRKGRKPVNREGLTWIAGGLDDASALDRLVTSTAAVIHCAGAVRGASRKDFDEVNEAGTQQLVEAVIKQQKMPRLLLVSSLAAREPALSHYAASKRRGEMAVQEVAGDLRWTILRPPAVFGPGEKEMLPLFRSMANGFAPVPAIGESRLSLIYVDDLASAVLAWLTADTCDGKILELDDGRSGGYNWDSILEIAGRVLRPGMAIHRVPIPISLLNLFAGTNLALARVLGYKPMLTPGKVRELSHSDWVCDSREFSELTGWQPGIDLEAGLIRLFKETLEAD